VAGAALTNPVDVLRNTMFQTDLGVRQTLNKLIQVGHGLSGFRLLQYLLPVEVKGDGDGTVPNALASAVRVGVACVSAGIVTCSGWPIGTSVFPVECVVVEQCRYVHVSNTLCHPAAAADLRSVQPWLCCAHCADVLGGLQEEGAQWAVRGMTKNLIAVAVPIAATIFFTDVFVSMRNGDAALPPAPAAATAPLQRHQAHRYMRPEVARRLTEADAERHLAREGSAAAAPAVGDSLRGS
jgi:hypothetical protein